MRARSSSRVSKRKSAAAVLLGDGAEQFRLFLHAGLAAVEFQDEKRRLGKAQLGVGIAGLHLQRVHQLDTGDGNAVLDGGDHRLAGGLDGRKAADGRGDRLGNALQPQRQLGDDAERALSTDQKTGQIVAGGGFLRPVGGLDDRAVRHDGGHVEDIVLHGAVAHRVGARSAGRGHAAEARVGARVDREEEPGVAEMLVQLLARHAGLDDDVEILGMDGKDLVHPRQIDGNAAERRVELPLERGAGAEGDDRRPVRGADADDLGDLFRGLGEDHRVGRLVLDPGGGVGVLLADALGFAQPLAKTLLENGDGGHDRVEGLEFLGKNHGPDVLPGDCTLTEFTFRADAPVSHAGILPHRMRTCTAIKAGLR